MKKDNKFSIALLIQGPLESIGRSGEMAKLKAEGLKSSDLVRYDCRKCIDELVTKYGYLFDQIILSTWDDEKFEYENEALEIYKFNKSSVPDIVPNRTLMKNKYMQKNNMLISFYGCFYGLKKIKKSINHIVRIRTDTIINLKLIYDFMINQYENETICVPKIKKSPYFVDLYFAGSKKIINKFINASIAKDKKGDVIYSNSPHIQPLLKFAYSEEFDSFPFEDKFFKKFGESSLEQYIILYKIFSKYFRALPFQVAKDLYWRGSQFPKESSWLKSKVEKLDFDCNNYYQRKLWNSSRSKVFLAKKNIRKIFLAVKKCFLKS